MKIIKTDLFNTINFIDYGFFSKIGEEGSELNVGFDREDDDSVVLQNRAKIAEYFKIKPDCLVFLNQQHENVVHVIDADNIGNYQSLTKEQEYALHGDAIITNQAGLLIAVKSADCAPILLADADSKYIAVIHAGWRGALGGVVKTTLQKMIDLGCKNIYASIGPSIQARSFEIGADIALSIDRKYINIKKEKYFFDMSGYILKDLLSCGARYASKTNIDTFSNHDFFSYRRQGKTFGVQCSGIMIKGE